MQGYEEAGTDLAQVLSKKETISTQKAAMSPDIAKALAKLANGLYVVTAAHSDQVQHTTCLACPARLVHHHKAYPPITGKQNFCLA